MTTVRRFCSFCFALALPTATALSAAPAAAQDDELPPGMRGDEDEVVADSEYEPQLPDDPARVFATVGVGASLRIVENVDFAQERFAPAFGDATAVYVLPGRGLRHGLGLSYSLNFSGDGGYAVGVDPGSQQVLAPTYLALLPVVGDDLLLTGKATLPITVSPSLLLGAELAVGAAYRVLAGLGVYAEITLGVHMGGESSQGNGTFHPLVSGEAGLFVDYELLP